MIIATWLTRKPTPAAWFIAMWSTVALYLGSVLYWTNTWNASSWMPASYADVFTRKEYWKLWTTLFAHADLGHLVSNSMLFIFLGYFLSGYFGAWIFPALAIAMGGVINAIVLSQYRADIHLIGMSGVVYWMGGAWLILYLLLDEQRRMTQRILRAVGVTLAVFMPSTAFDPQISYGAHLVGFIAGLITGAIFYYLYRRKFAAAVVRVEIPEEPDESREADLGINA
jgi:rhomboid protease GluP